MESLPMINPKYLRILLVIFVSGSLTACGGTAMNSSGITPTVEITQSPTPSAMTTAEITRRYQNMINATIVAIIPTIATPTPYPNLPQDKAADEQKRAVISSAIQTAVASNPPPPEFDPESLHTPIAARSPITEPARSRPLAGGILYEDAKPNAECHTIVKINSWHGSIAGVDTYLCAGRTPTRQEIQGILDIRVKISNPPDPEIPYEFASYYPPASFGGISIENIIGTQIILHSTSGSQLIFDMATRQWLGALPLTPPATLIP